MRMSHLGWFLRFTSWLGKYPSPVPLPIARLQLGVFDLMLLPCWPPPVACWRGASTCWRRLDYIFDPALFLGGIFGGHVVANVWSQCTVRTLKVKQWKLLYLVNLTFISYLYEASKFSITTKGDSSLLWVTTLGTKVQTNHERSHD